MPILETQCWCCHALLPATPGQTCPNCHVALRPPGEPAPVAGVGAPPGTTPPTAPASRRSVTASATPPWLRTALLALLIVIVLAAVGVAAGHFAS